MYPSKHVLATCEATTLRLVIRVGGYEKALYGTKV